MQTIHSNLQTIPLDDLSSPSYHISSSSWETWYFGRFGSQPLKNLFEARKEILHSLFEKAMALKEEYQGTHICCFNAQSSMVAPIGDILTKVYELLDSRDPRFPVLFAKNCDYSSAKEFLSKNEDVDDMLTPSHRDSLVSLTMDIFKDMRPKDSAMYYFLQNTCGMNSFKNALNATKVAEIVINDIAKEFNLAGEEYAASKAEQMQAVEKIIALANTREGILNFIAIPRTHIESEDSKFYASVSKGVPVPLPSDTQSFYDSLQKDPSALQFAEFGAREHVFPQGRLLRSALTEQNKEIVAIRLRTMDQETTIKYEQAVTQFAQKIIEMIPTKSSA